jgi:hypothetical protein
MESLSSFNLAKYLFTQNELDKTFFKKKIKIKNGKCIYYDTSCICTCTYIYYCINILSQKRYMRNKYWWLPLGKEQKQEED